MLLPEAGPLDGAATKPLGQAIVEGEVPDLSDHSSSGFDLPSESHDRESALKREPPSTGLALNNTEKSSPSASPTKSDEKNSQDQKDVVEASLLKTESSTTIVQEVKITRVPPEEWRQVKRERKIDPQQGVLIVSSKSSFRRGLRKDRKVQHDADENEGKVTDPATKGSGSLDVPYRLAINSSYLLRAIGLCTGEEFTETQNVLVRPFKYLVHYEADIRQYFKDLELTYAQAEAKAKPLPTKDLKHEAIESYDPVSNVADGNRADDDAEIARKAAECSRRERDEFSCLIEFMDRDMADIFDIKSQVIDQSIKEIAFEHLWQLYRPGNITYRPNLQDDDFRCQVYQILHITGGRVCFDSGRKLKYDAVYHRDWDSESETEEKCRDIVKSSGNEVTTFIIDCFFMDFDGQRVGPRAKRFAVPRYNGTRLILSLPICPIFLHPNSDRLRESLLARGSQFLELKPGTHMKYDGNSLRELNLTSQSYNNFVIEDAEVQGEVIVDQAAGVDHFRNKLYKWRIKLGGGILFNPTGSDSRETFDPLPKKNDDDWVTDVYDDSKFEADRRSDFLQATELLNFLPPEKHHFSDEGLVLLPPRQYGYSLLDHKWLALDINCLSKIPRRSLGAKFEDVVLPEGHGMLLRALIKNHVRGHKQNTRDPKNSMDEFAMDVVAGKGKGLIILLHGVPGVGKTSTAECVAAELKRPLLPITCGDIGTTAKEAEATLGSYCALAQKWRCVLLLDEADVFLAKREKGDIHRNSLVSVFLRVLEYYSGVIILTTNRVGEFDEAFRSRIHIGLYYPKLTQASTKEIWDKNLSRLKQSGMDIDIEEDRIRRFVDKHWEQNENNPSRRWNGRQIKNAFQTAIALANWDFHDSEVGAGLERPMVKAAHFKRVAQTSAHFDDYIRDVHGFQEEDDVYGRIAGDSALRQDSHQGQLFEATSRESRRPRRHQPARRGTFSKTVASAQSHQDRSDDTINENDDDDANMQELKLKLKIAQLKLKGRKTKTVDAVTDDDEDEEMW